MALRLGAARVTKIRGARDLDKESSVSEKRLKLMTIKHLGRKRQVPASGCSSLEPSTARSPRRRLQKLGIAAARLRAIESARQFAGSMATAGRDGYILDAAVTRLGLASTREPTSIGRTTACPFDHCS